mgnify:CR=1 FL=1
MNICKRISVGFTNLDFSSIRNLFGDDAELGFHFVKADAKFPHCFQKYKHPNTMSNTTTKSTAKSPAKSQEKSQPTLEDAKADAIRAVEELRDVATLKATELKDAALEKSQQLRNTAVEKAGHIKERAQDQIGATTERIGDYRSEGEEYIRANPGKSVLVALGLGFLLGRFFR